MPRNSPDCRFHSILCAVDFSANSAAALRHAAALARADETALTAVFIVDPLLSAAVATARDEHALERRSEQELRRFVARTLGARRAGTVRSLTTVGSPAAEVLAMARRLRADLIVVGTQGLTGVSKVFFGSTTDQVLRRSTIPVLAVPPTGGAPRAGWPRRLLAVATALDAGAARDLRAAGCLARAFGARLLLVHAVPEVVLPPWWGADARAYTKERVLHAQGQLDELCGALDNDVALECRAVSGDPSETIAALGAKERIDLLVLPLRKPAGLLGGRKRAAAYRTLCAARRPVLAWPAGASARKRRR